MLHTVEERYGEKAATDYLMGAVQFLAQGLNADDNPQCVQLRLEDASIDDLGCSKLLCPGVCHCSLLCCESLRLGIRLIRSRMLSHRLRASESRLPQGR